MTSPPPSDLPLHEARRLWTVAGGDHARFEELVRRRTAGEPLQYLEGTAPFGPFDLVVDERVLIPRPETEQLWELARRVVDRPRVVVDMCTGSGALAIACKTTWPDARIVASDLSEDAIAVASGNVKAQGLDVELVRGDLFEALPHQLRLSVDLIVSNPPYVGEDEWPDLPPDVRREPRMALVAGPEGTEILARIAQEAPSWLAKDGAVICEMGETQADAVRTAFSRTFDSVAVHRDLTGRDRFVVATTRRV